MKITTTKPTILVKAEFKSMGFRRELITANSWDMETGEWLGEGCWACQGTVKDALKELQLYTKMAFPDKEVIVEWRVIP